MIDRTVHIVFSGGGTGGHLFPGLATAEQLAKMIPRVRITFCGSGKPFERKFVTRAGFDYLTLPSRPLPRGARDIMAFVVENLSSYLSAGRFLREENVAVVVGTGGYASVPMARAAARHNVPLVLLEQNVIPGKATRWLARRAALICTSFEQTSDRLRSGSPVRVTGNPVREILARGPWSMISDKQNQSSILHSPSAISNPQSPIPTPLQSLLVLGGSGGARSLNENVPRALYKIRGQLSGWEIVHQTGEADADATRSLYAKLDVPATVVPFVSDMPAMLANTSLAVCRAGATTLAELAAAGVPALLLPYPHAADNHQAENARHYTAAGGCVTIDEREFLESGKGRLDDQMGDMLFFLLANEKTRARMASAMRDLARPNAATDMAELIWSIASSRAVQADLAVA